MIPIHITAARSRRFGALFVFMLSVTIFRAMPAEARVVVWPCTYSSELEPPVRVSRCTLALPSTWRVHQRKEYPAPTKAQESTLKVPDILHPWHRGIAWIHRVVGTTTECVLDLLETTFASSEMIRKEH